MPTDSIQPDQAPAVEASQSSPDPAPSTSAAVSSPTTSASPSGTDPSSSSTDPGSPQAAEIDLLSAEEYAAAKDDPAAMRAALNRAFTQKTQALASERKKLEAWQAVVDGLQNDPVRTLEILGQQLGVQVVPPTTPQTAQPVQQPSARDQLVTSLKTKLDEFGLAPLSDEIIRVTEGLAQEIAGQQLKPLQEHTNRLLTDSQQREVATVMQRFETKHPDWKQHEKAMTDLAQRYKPAMDQHGRLLVTEDQYLDDLYRLATYETSVKSEAQKAIDRMRAAAESAEPRTTTVTSDKVSHQAPKGASFRDAVAAAKRGERWE